MVQAPGRSAPDRPVAGAQAWFGGRSAFTVGTAGTRFARGGGEALRTPFRRSTYGSVGYLLAALPLGIAYTAFIALGFALGFGLLPIVVGIPILSLALGVIWRLMDYERRLAAQVLGEPPL